MKNAIIKIEHMSKHFPVAGGKFTALKAIDLTFQKAEFTGIVGPSGSGKTTLLNIIGSLDSQSEGDVWVLGKSVKDLNNWQAARLRSRHIGFIFQTYNLLPYYTVYENIEYPLLLLKIEKAERKLAVNEALNWLGLTDKAESRPSQLSGGECQRVAIARAIVKKPIIVLADEPTANLDADNSHHILQTMKELNNKMGVTFIFATHDQKVIQYLQRKITLLDGEVSRDEITGERS